MECIHTQRHYDDERRTKRLQQKLYPQLMVMNQMKSKSIHMTEMIKRMKIIRVFILSGYIGYSTFEYLLFIRGRNESRFKGL